MSDKSFDEDGTWSPPGGRELLVESDYEAVEISEEDMQDTSEESLAFAAELIACLDDRTLEGGASAATIGRIAALLARVNSEALIAQANSQELEQ